MKSAVGNRDVALSEEHREGLRLLGARLAIARTFIGVARQGHELGDTEKAERARARAEREYAELLERVTGPQYAAHLVPAEVAHVEKALQRIRKDLDGVSALSRVAQR